MAWIEMLHATYEACKGREPEGAEALMPVSHAVQQAHIEITIDGAGNFKEARAIQKEETVLPATEQSAGRTGKLPPPHPLCDKVQYCAGDYRAHGGAKPSFFPAYESQLASWCQSAEYSHPKAGAVLDYVRRGTLVAELVKHKVLHVGEDGRLITQWAGEAMRRKYFASSPRKTGSATRVTRSFVGSSGWTAIHALKFGKTLHSRKPGSASIPEIMPSRVFAWQPARRNPPWPPVIRRESGMVATAPS